VRSDWPAPAPVPLDVDSVGRIVRRVFPRAIVERTQLLHGGRHNTLYAVSLADERRDLVLKVWSDSSRARPGIEAALEKVLSADVPTARPHHFLPDGAAGRPCLVMSRVEGERLETALGGAAARDVEHLGDGIGRVLAAIHRMTFAATGMLDSATLTVVERFDTGSAGLIAFARDILLRGPGGERLGSALTERFLGWLETGALPLDRHDNVPCLTHCDFGGSNILVRRGAAGWEVAAIIDWEFACSGTPFFDVGNLLRPPVGLLPGFVAGFVEGYRAGGGSLPPDWKRLSELSDLFAWIEFLSRVECPRQVVDSARASILRTMGGVSG
jgi:aminoglycoside phosphotransferase (APT) family kinase protein